MSLGIISKNFCHEFGARREPSHPQRRIPRPRPVILMKNRTGGANGFNGSISAYMEHDRLVLLALRKSQTIDIDLEYELFNCIVTSPSSRIDF